MAGNTSTDSEAITGINVTPLVDIMLVLLIIFMVTANYINAQSIKVELPKASTGEDLETVNLAFVIDKDSNVYLNGRLIELPDLKYEIEEFKSKGNNLQAVIGADKAAPHGSVMKVIDTLRINGVMDFAINIEAE